MICDLIYNRHKTKPLMNSEKVIEYEQLVFPNLDKQQMSFSSSNNGEYTLTVHPWEPNRLSVQGKIII